MINWIDVDSQSIAKIAYNSELKTMYIAFQGSITDTPYRAVPEEEFNAFRNANNIDEYYETHVKDTFERVEFNTDKAINCDLKQQE